MDLNDPASGLREPWVPKWEVELSPAEQTGYQILVAIEEERKTARRRMDAKVQVLMDKLKETRQQIERFDREIHALIPTLKAIHESRSTQLTMVEREQAAAKWNTSVELKCRFTQDGYVMAVRGNKAMNAERALYSSFRVEVGKAGGIACVQMAYKRATGAVPPAPPRLD
jgi:hypothetical protein